MLRVLLSVVVVVVLVCFAGNLSATPSCTESLIYITPPPEVSVSNLVSENFDSHPTQNAFIAGSGLGFLFTITCDGNAVPLTNFTTNKLTTGVKVNPYDNLLYATFGDVPPLINQTQQGFIGVFDLSTGENLDYVDLTSLGDITKGVLPNDFTFRSDGLVITDSLSNRIYFFDTTTREASLYSSSPLYDGIPLAEFFGLALGLEGIFRPEGANYFVASKLSDASGSNPSTVLVKIPDSDPDSPSAVPITNLNASIFAGFDGIAYDKSNCNLYGANSLGRVYRVYSTDNWDTAVLDEIAYSAAIQANNSLAPTVSVVVTDEGNIYALNAGGFSTSGQSTIEAVSFATSPQNRCSVSSAASSLSSPFSSFFPSAASSVLLKDNMAVMN